MGFLGIGDKYYWVLGMTRMGKRTLLGPYDTTEEAQNKEFNLQQSETFELPTKDQGRATKMIRAKLLSRGKAADDAISPMRHKLDERDNNFGVHGDTLDDYL